MIFCFIREKSARGFRVRRIASKLMEQDDFAAPPLIYSDPPPHMKRNLSEINGISLQKYSIFSDPLLSQNREGKDLSMEKASPAAHLFRAPF
jgi:predicted FMN-binding regulatory protein PaiB